MEAKTFRKAIIENPQEWELLKPVIKRRIKKKYGSLKNAADSEGISINSLSNEINLVKKTPPTEKLIKHFIHMGVLKDTDFSETYRTPDRYRFDESFRNKLKMDLEEWAEIEGLDLTFITFLKSAMPDFEETFPFYTPINTRMYVDTGFLQRMHEEHIRGTDYLFTPPDISFLADLQDRVLNYTREVFRERAGEMTASMKKWAEVSGDVEWKNHPGCEDKGNFIVMGVTDKPYTQKVEHEWDKHIKKMYKFEEVRNGKYKGKKK